MKQSILDFITDKDVKWGLLLADMPTGYGKTYSAARAMFEYIYKENGEKKQFFITTLKKNLPYEELREAYNENGMGNRFEEDVLIIKSNFDFVYENILNVEIPMEYQTETFKKLKQKVELLKNLENKRELIDAAMIQIITDEIRKTLEYNFRKEIERIIKNELPKDINKRLDIIKNNKKYQWIGRIYPTVFTDNYKIYLLTVDKFLVKNTVLIKPSYNFINSEISDESIIYIDEFDAGKTTIEGALIKKALDSKNDYIQLFKKIYNSYRNHEFSKEIANITTEYFENSKYNFFTLKEEAKRIFTEFNLKYNYKTEGIGIDKKQSFLFNDNSYHTMLRNNSNYIRAFLDEDKKKVSIHFENKEEYYQNRKEDDIVIYSLVRNISSFLRNFKFMVLSLAQKYTEYINKERVDKDDEFTIENAIKTIYREFSLTKEEIQLLMGDICENGGFTSSLDELIPDMSFYNNGFKYFEFEDSDEHLNETKFNNVDLSDTAEKIIVYLSFKAKVIGISATARIMTVTGNYDLNYFKNKLGSNFKFIKEDVYKKIESELNNEWSFYNEGKVKVNTSIVNMNLDHITLEERLEIIFTKKTAKKYKNILELQDDYIWKRYCDVFAAIREFVIKDDIKSFLCLNMVLPKSMNKKGTFDLDIFNLVIEDLAKEYKKELNKENIVVLKSNNFDEDKEKIKERLKKNEKIFIMSSYKTIGAGQNLQYPIPEGLDVLKIAEGKSINDSRIKHKDIDAIFLGDITNIAVNINNEEKLKKEELLKYILQIEYLYENDEISYSTLDRLIKLGFKKYVGSKAHDAIYNELRESISIKRQATRDVMQAIGRMSRTFVKNKNIYIYTVEKLAGKVDLDCLQGKILSPEMKAFVKLVEEMKPKYNEEDLKILNKAERISSRGKNHIMKMLSRTWTQKSMELWKELREVVLKYPTASTKEALDNSVIRNLYIQGYNNLNSYLYAQKGDFSDVVIDFENDKYVFEKSNRCIDRKVSEVSEVEARLGELLQYRGLKEYFEAKGFAIDFKINEFILSPILFNNIYKGALGEEIGKFILEQELGIQLNEINDPDKFEFFDFEISEGVYVDFKHWKHTYRQEKQRDDVKNEISRKLEQIKGKRVYIINILADEEFSINKQVDGKIIEIPYLINSSGKINSEAKKQLMGEILNDN